MACLHGSVEKLPAPGIAPAWHAFLGQGCIQTHHNSAMALFVLACRLDRSVQVAKTKTLEEELINHAMHVTENIHYCPVRLGLFD